MPFCHIHLAAGKPAAFREAVGATLYGAMRDTINVPENDRFQVISEHPPENFICDPTYLGIQRTKDCIVIQVTLNEGRTLEMKKAFYKAVADRLHAELGVRREDVLINLVEVKKENWSFGNGEAQYA